LVATGFPRYFAVVQLWSFSTESALNGGAKGLAATRLFDWRGSL